MKRSMETTQNKVHYNESEIVMLPEFVGGNWVFLNTRMVYRLKVQK